MSKGAELVALYDGYKAADHVKSLEAAQELLGAVETIKGRLNAAFAARVIEKGFYQELRLLAGQMESSVRDFALDHERKYEKSVGFFNRSRRENLGSGIMIRGND